MDQSSNLKNEHITSQLVDFVRTMMLDFICNSNKMSIQCQNRVGKSRIRDLSVTNTIDQSIYIAVKEAVNGLINGFWNEMEEEDNQELLDDLKNECFVDFLLYIGLHGIMYVDPELYVKLEHQFQSIVF